MESSMRFFLLFLFSISAFSATALACPEYSAPYCQGSERLDIEKDEHGCNVVSCVAAEANAVDENFQAICSSFKPEPCSKLENPSSITDANGCKVATCAKVPD
jgi:hypothetical protein